MRNAILFTAVVVSAGTAWAEKPLPDKAKLDAAKITARDRYFTELKQASEETLKSFLDAADATADDDARQAALYLVVADAAVGDGQVRLALDALERLGREFDYDALAGKMKLLESASKTTRGAAARTQLVNRLLELVDEAVGVRRFDVADEAATLGESVAARLRDARLRKDLAAKKAKVEARRRESGAETAAFARAEALLKDDPRDPEANRLRGIQLAMSDKWPEALEHLARGDDEELRQTVAAETRRPADADAQVALADAWWQLADSLESDAQGAALRTRAVFWYSRALAGAKGLRRTRAERRIKSSGAVAAAAAAQASGDDNLAEVLLAPGVALRLVKIAGDEDGKIKTFWLGQTEMTESQWAAVMVGPAPPSNLPKVNISFTDCRRLCARLNAAPLGRRYRFRLPTKEEFAHVCGKPSTYAGGLADYAWFRENAPQRTRQPVAQKKTNPFGLFDIFGNVWEFGDDGKFYGLSAWDTIKNPLPAFTSVDLPANYQGRQADYLGENLGLRLAADLR